ncbi:hypothetical protein HPB52_009973 [Rhipicephalus sanguineus]|uniref:DUF5641 domain-containing protein n=1 Tax=Rhipicephalus sanguineus TaxID=34632 RepID=A0A9D4Q5Y7_RHISA|nr:hypothetical protein HPB52_009973 [Rhipicephalus sanguineus]
MGEAHLLTTGITAVTLLRSSLWLRDPSWLSTPKHAWKDDVRCSKPIITAEEVVPEAQCVVPLAQQEALLTVTDYSRYSRLLRVTTGIYRFINNAAKRRASTVGPLNAQEIARAEHYLTKQVQHSHFPDDLAALSTSTSADRSSVEALAQVVLLLLRSAHEAAPKTPPRLQVGVVVLVHDDSPPIVWKMVRVTELLPGRDNIARACCMRLASGAIV